MRRIPGWRLDPEKTQNKLFSCVAAFLGRNFGAGCLVYFPYAVNRGSGEPEPEEEVEWEWERQLAGQRAEEKRIKMGQNAPTPSGETAPKPVTTTRRMAWSVRRDRVLYSLQRETIEQGKE